MKEEILENIIEARSEFKAVKLLYENEFNRTAVARLYYVCFYYARAILLSKDMSFKSHRGVISKFGEHFVKTNIFPTSVGRLIRALFEFRQGADYELIKRGGEFTKEYIEKTSEFVNLAEEYLKAFINE